MPKSIDSARSAQFVRNAKLPLPSQMRGVEAAAKAQAAVVCSNLLSFATNVAPQWRQDLMNCSLFAQLWAKAEVAEGRLMPSAGSLKPVKTTLRHCSHKLSVNTPMLDALCGDLAEQLKDHARGFNRKLPSKILAPAAG